MNHSKRISLPPNQIRQISQQRSRLIDQANLNPNSASCQPESIIDQITASTQHRIQYASPSTRSRLSTRLSELQTIQTRIQNDPTIEILHVLGWGESCTIKAPKKNGISEIDTIIYKKNNIIYAEQLGSNYQRFTIQKMDPIDHSDGIGLGAKTATYATLKANAILRHDTYAALPKQTVQWAGQTIQLKSDPSRCQLILKHPDKELRTRLLATLTIGCEEDPVPPSTHAGTIRCSITQLLRLQCPIEGLENPDLAVSLESYCFNLQQMLSMSGMKQLNYQPKSNTWTFHDTFRTGRMTLSADALCDMIAHNADGTHHWTIKQRAPLLKLLIDTPTPKGILQGQTGKQLTTLGLGATLPSAPFIDGIDDLDVAGAQTNLTLGGTGLGAFTLLPFALCILSEGARGANQGLNELIEQLNNARLAYHANPHTTHDTAPTHPLLQSEITEETLTQLPNTLIKTIESLTQAIRAARAEKEAITAMAAGLQLAFISEMIASLVRWSMAQPHAGHAIERALSPFTNYFATYGQMIFCVVSLLKAIDAYQEAKEIETKIRQLNQTRWPSVHKQWKQDIQSFFSETKKFKTFECGMLTAVSLGQAAMFSASVLAAIWDGGASMSLMSASATYPTWITGVRSTGAFQTLAFAAGNSLMDTWHAAHYDTDENPDLSHLREVPQDADTDDKLSRHWDHIQHEVIPRYTVAKSYQLAIDYRDTNDLNHTIDPNPKQTLWITRKSNIFHHFNPKKRPHYHAVSPAMTTQIQAYIHGNYTVLKNRATNPIAFYHDAFSAMKLIAPDTPTNLAGIIRALEPTEWFNPFHEALLDRLSIGRYKHGYTHKGGPFGSYIRSHTLTKRRKIYQGNPIKELTNGAISKLTPRAHKGVRYYQFKQVLTGDIQLPNTALLRKHKTIRQFDWNTYLKDYEKNTTDPILKRIEAMIFSALDDVILHETKVLKRNLRTHLFVVPQLLFDNT